MAKTAKKPSAKKPKSKSASAKAKTVSKKTVAAKTPKAKTTSSVTFQKLYKFNLFSAAATLVFAILSVVFLSKQSVDMVLAHATKNELATSSANALGPAYKTLMTVEIRYMLAAIFVISAIFSLLLATKLRSSYENGVKNSTSGLRWLLTGITYGLTLEFASLLAGVQDVMTLKLIAGLVVVTSLLAWMAERENKGSKKHYTAFGLSVFTGVIAWFPLVASLIGTALYGIDNFSWYVYVLAAFVLVGSASIGLNQYRHARDGLSAKDYLQLEGRYISTDFLIKFGVFIIIISALYK